MEALRIDLTTNAPWQRRQVRLGVRSLGAALLCVAGAGVSAQGSGDSRALVIKPTLSISETLTDRWRDSSGRDSAESITTISPGIRVSSRSGRVQGLVDYSLVGVLHARDSESSSIRHRLSASVVAEVVPEHLTVDLRGSISRQPVSAFGLQSADPNLGSGNYSDVKTFSVSPALRGTLGGVIAVQARLQAAATDSGTRSASDSTNASATLSIGPARVARLGWSLDASRAVSDFDAGRRTESDRLVGGLSYALTPELRVSARAGVESNDFTSIPKQDYDTWGGGLTWTPTDRTRVLIDADKRSFGRSHSVSLEHRMRRSVWRISDRQDVNTGSAQSAGAAVAAFDLFFELFKSQEPDPVAREQLVNSFLQRNGIAPNAQIGGGFLSSAATVQRRQELSLAVQGVRSNVVAAVFLTRGRRADTVAVVPDDLAGGELRQRGLSVTLTHRLTPTSTIGLLTSTQRSSTDATGARSRLHSISATWTERLSQRINFSLVLRHSDFESHSDAYRENALVGNVSVVF